jgi:hypothetical protein
MGIVRPVILAIAVLIAVSGAPGTARAADPMAANVAAVTAVINNAIAAFNKGDGKTWAAQCTSQVGIISNIPPSYQYTSCADWWTAHAANSKRGGVTGETVTAGAAWHVMVTGDRAYASMPCGFAFKQNGKAVKTAGDLTVALQKTANGWLMTGWSWAAH